MNLSNFKHSNTYNWFCDFLDYKIEVNLNSEGPINSYSEIIKKINEWDNNFFIKLESMLFDFYEDTLIMCGETEPTINSKADIWGFMRIGSIEIINDGSEKFIMLTGGCDWEEEHGLEIDINENGRVLYVGCFIGNGYSDDPDNPMYSNFVQGDI